MTMRTAVDYEGDLEKYTPAKDFKGWKLVVSGYWSQGPYHSGHIAYYIGTPSPNVWVMKAVQRNTALDDVTQEDVREGWLNDDQIQAMWGTTLKKAQRHKYQSIMAVCEDAPPHASVKAMAHLLYDAIGSAKGMIVDEHDKKGLFGR